MQTQSPDPIRNAETAARNIKNLTRWAEGKRTRLQQIEKTVRRERQRRGLLLMGRPAL